MPMPSPSSSSRERWKRQEREIAEALGGQRQPNTGHSQADVTAPGWAIQVKTRQTLPAWLWEAVAQAHRDAHPGEQAALVLSQVSQGVKARRLVVLEWETFTGMVGDARKQ